MIAIIKIILIYIIITFALTIIIVALVAFKIVKDELKKRGYKQKINYIKIPYKITFIKCVTQK